MLFRYLHRSRLYWIYYLVSVVLIVGIFTLLDLYERSDIAFAVSLGTIGQSFEAQHIALAVFPWWGNMVAAALMLGANNAISTFYRNMQQDEDSERLQRQNIQAEMYYLKHQINPHFLMNTLNNIHALIDIDSEAAKQTIIQLSDMMRYVVYDTGGNAISLREDINFIKNYIKLMRIRYTNDVEITIDYPHELPERIAIPPLLLIVFVENAFKHGVSNNHHSFIHISLFCDKQQLTAIISNSRLPQTASHHTGGIGLENVRKRLDLTYGREGYSLDIAEEESSYTVKLVIPTLHA